MSKRVRILITSDYRWTSSPQLASVSMPHLACKRLIVKSPRTCSGTTRTAAPWPMLKTTYNSLKLACKETVQGNRIIVRVSRRCWAMWRGEASSSARTVEGTRTKIWAIITRTSIMPTRRIWAVRLSYKGQSREVLAGQTQVCRSTIKASRKPIKIDTKSVATPARSKLS